MEAMVNRIFADSDLAKHILKVSYCIPMAEMSSGRCGKEKWGIKLADPMACHIAMQNFSEVKGHRDDPFLFPFAFSDRDRQIVEINSADLKIQGLIDPDASVDQSANESIDSMAVLAFGFERQNLMDVGIIEDSQLLFFFGQFLKTEWLPIGEGLRAMAIVLAKSGKH